MAKQEFFQEHWDEEDKDRPGGVSSGRGWVILWSGPGADTPYILGRPSEVVAAIMHRIEFYQKGKFACEENAKALQHLAVVHKLLGWSCIPDPNGHHYVDDNGNPAGGYNVGKGFLISWQRGPLGKADTPERKEPNGGFVETLIEVVMQRLAEFKETHKNPELIAAAIDQLIAANSVLDSRTRRRVADKTEGTHEGK